MAAAAAGQQHYRVCVLCEAMCGLEITHDGGEVLGIRGDAEDHFSRGHICPKGNALEDLHSDPERIRQPLKRRADGGFAPVDWDEALDDIADRITAIQQAHGRDAVGFYIGNPSVHHLGAGLTLFPLAATLKSGTPVVLDFTANWCAPCHELERFTFSDKRVKEAFFIVEADQKQLVEVARRIDAGTIKAFVSAVVPLEEAAVAYGKAVRETSGHGKVAITVGA
jgi:thiol-disulfide isomerase/thioredoxin